MNDVIASYSLLAKLLDDGTNIYDFVYLPLCKRAISKFVSSQTAVNGKVNGTATQVADVIKTEYCIDIPVIITKQLIIAVSKKLSNKEKKEFKFVFDNKSSEFSCDKFIFDTLEDRFETQKRNSCKLQLEFEKFAKDENVADDLPTLNDFIRKKQVALRSFFGKQKQMISESDMEQSYLIHAKFIKHIERNEDMLFKELQKAYIGSLIATYLEMEIKVDRHSANKTVYYLDTNLILSAIDLQRKEWTRPVKDLLSLIKKTSGIASMLSVTNSECSHILANAVRCWNNTSPTSMINEAAITRNKPKSEIANLCVGLREFVQKELGIQYQEISVSDSERFSESPDVEELKKYRWNKNSAAPDVIAYLYVRKNRGEKVQNATKAKYWFVTTNIDLCAFNHAHSLLDSTDEIISLEELTSMLFLQDPRSNAEEVSRIGLNNLIAQTIAEESIDKDLINDLSERLQHNKEKTKFDYELLISYLSQESSRQLKHLLDEPNDDKFVESAHTLALKRQVAQENREKENDLAIRQAKEQITAVAKENEELRKTTNRITQSNDKLKNQISNERIVSLCIISFMIAVISVLSELLFSNHKYPIYSLIFIALSSLILMIRYRNSLIVKWIYGVVMLISGISSILSFWGWDKVVNFLYDLFNATK